MEGIPEVLFLTWDLPGRKEPPKPKSPAWVLRCLRRPNSRLLKWQNFLTVGIELEPTLFEIGDVAEV